MCAGQLSRLDRDEMEDGVERNVANKFLHFMQHINKIVKQYITLATVLLQPTIGSHSQDDCECNIAFIQHFNKQS